MPSKPTNTTAAATTRYPVGHQRFMSVGMRAVNETLLDPSADTDGPPGSLRDGVRV